MAKTAVVPASRAVTDHDPVTGEIIPPGAAGPVGAVVTGQVGQVIQRGNYAVKIVQNITLPRLRMDPNLPEQTFCLTFTGVVKKKKDGRGNELADAEVINHDNNDTLSEFILATVFKSELRRLCGIDDGSYDFSKLAGRTFLIKKEPKPLRAGEVLDANAKRYSLYTFSEVELQR